MEDLIFYILCILSIINIKIKCLNTFFHDYMELSSTNAIKGIFVWIIILQHYRGYYKRNYKYIYHTILNCTLQKMVSLFLFYSGFGIYESIKIKGLNYVRTLPRKAFILFIKFQIILFIFLLINFFLGIKIKLKQYLYAIIFKSGIGNSYWFSFTIISFYCYSYISFIYIKKNKYIYFGFISIIIISFLHTYFVYNYYHPKSFPSADNILCFIVGLFYSLLKKHIDKIIMKNDIYYFGILSSFIILYTYFYNYKIKFLWTVSIIHALFSLIIVFISMKIKFNNEFLNLLNSHSYSIYLLQRAIMKFIWYKNYFNSNNFIRFFIVFTLILFASCIFDKNTFFINLIFQSNISDIKRKNGINEIKEKLLDSLYKNSNKIIITN